MKQNNRSKILLVLVLLIAVQSANQSLAQDTKKSTHQGLFLGVNAGFGGSLFEYKDDTRSITEDALSGGFGGARIGYAFNPKFALSIEGCGFGRGHDQDMEWIVGAAMLAGTLHPVGKGFFLRAGIGVGGGDFTHPDTGEKISIKERGAFLFSVGYDWHLNDSLSLGLSANTMSIDAGGATGYNDDCVGGSGVSVQFNWFL